jgi:hypothetical protein
MKLCVKLRPGSLRGRSFALRSPKERRSNLGTSSSNASQMRVKCESVVLDVRRAARWPRSVRAEMSAGAPPNWRSLPFSAKKVIAAQPRSDTGATEPVSSVFQVRWPPRAARKEPRWPATRSSTTSRGRSMSWTAGTNDDPVRDNTSPKLGLGGEPDPMRHLHDPYVHKHPTPEKTSSQQDI